MHEMPTLKLLFTASALVAGFWPLALALGILTFTGGLRRNLFFLWLTCAGIKLLLYTFDAPVYRALIPEPANTLSFWLVGAVVSLAWLVPLGHQRHWFADRWAEAQELWRLGEKAWLAHRQRAAAGGQGEE